MLLLLHAVSWSSYTFKEKHNNLPGTQIQAEADHRPLVSIVVVVFQAREELRTLLKNLQSCDLSQSELVVVDGGSTDGTVELIQSSPVVDRWISEPDRGIYDAMNKGIDLAEGKYLLHLNAGDGLIYLPRQDLTNCFEQQIDVASFCVLVNGVRKFCPRTGIRTHIENTWHHQGTFYRKEAHLHYDPSFRVFGDFELNQRMRAAGCSVRLFSEVVATHSTGGASSVLSLTPAHRAEFWQIVRKYSGPGYLLLAFLKFQMYALRARLTSRAKAA